MLAALRSGFTRLAAAPGVAVVLWAASFLVALPAAVIVEEAIYDSVSESRVGESLRSGFDSGWYGEFKAEARGLAATLEPSQVGVGAWLDVIDRWWNGDLFRQRKEIVAFGLVFALVWLFLVGGVLSRLRRPGAVGRRGALLADGGRFFFRFLRLAVFAAPAYYGIFRLAGWLFPRLERALRDVTEETTVLAVYLAAALAIVVLLMVVKTILDYARIALVVDDRRSSLWALATGLGFVWRRPAAVGGLVLTFAALTVALLWVYALVAPGVAQSSPWTIVAAFAFSQLFALARVALRVGLLGSELALFEDRRRAR